MLILVRHGESVANAQGLLVGRTDAELTEKGMAQAASVRQLLCATRSSRCGPARSAGRGTRRRSSASASRSRWMTAWIEVDYGEYECQPLRDIPADMWREWRRDPDFRPPGGETLAEVDARVAAACDELFAADGAGARAPGRRRRGGEPRHADKGGGGLGARRGRRALVATPSADGVGDPHRVGQRRARPPRFQRGGARPP